MRSKVKSTMTKLGSSLIGLFFFISVFFIIYKFNKLDRILYDPLTPPSMWCDHQPCCPITLFDRSLLLVQPFSTSLVYLLGITTLGIALYIIVNHKYQQSRIWWSIALLLWGLGAILAGTSYQAFSYEIKCEGNVFCTWTSLWEIFYLLLSVGSVNAMMISQVYSSSTGTWRKFQIYYALVNMSIYCVLVIIGSLIPLQFLISFGMMVLFLAPSILIFFVHNLSRFLKFKKQADFKLLWVWLGLGIVISAYYLYYIFGITEILWDRGLWFSDNDILHIGLIIWMIYIAITVKKYVVDIP
ncbi:MAG: hypothetical protein JW776_14560 [Candidatus Lokiarchaeota archaeon]|nr:hypothetical protein [Candidatus Lokiarchaeota archaeon]